MEELKKQIVSYWSQRAEAFGDQRLREYFDEKHEEWLRELRRYLPDVESGKTRILDVGTGTGFFAFLLAGEGYRATGIDLTEDMIAKARETAEKLKIFPEFLVMDAEEPSFGEESFDVIVTRNLTWSLPHLKRAYRSWHRLLAPGGILINFDADYCRETPAEHLPEHHAHKALSEGTLREYEAIKGKLRRTQQERPAWDEALLREVGFSDVRVDTSVWERIYARKDEFYNPTPIFTITARA